MKRALAMPLAAVMIGCATIPPPDVLAQVDQVRAAPAAVEAKKHAPDVFADAEKLRAEAQAAHEAGDSAGAQILAENAIAAYHEAVAVARAAKADATRLAAKKAADDAEAKLSALDREHQEVASDIAALEKRLEVLEGLELPQPSGEAGGAREKARAEAAASLHVQARLLCAAGELLATSLAADASFERPPALAEAKKQLGALDTAIAGGAAAPIDEAMRARASCLQALTLVRRAGNDQARAPGRGDALLADLSRLGVGKASRDDRGVVLTLRGIFEGDGVASAGEETLRKVTEMLDKHPGFPVMVVVHQAKPGQTTLHAARAAALVSRLRTALGEKRVGQPELAGADLPLVDPKGAHGDQNERVDLVFITPESL